MLVNWNIFLILYFVLFFFIKSRTSLSLNFLFLISNEHTTEVSVLEIGKKAIGPYSVKIWTAVLFSIFLCSRIVVYARL